MRLQGFKRIYKTDYKQEFQDLVDRLSVSLNYGIEQLYTVLDRKVSLKDNILCSYKEFEIEVDSNGIPKVPSSFSLETPGRVIIMQVGKATNLTNPTTYPTSGIFITFDQVENNIIIKHITGLPANNKFRLNVVAYP